MLVKPTRERHFERCQNRLSFHDAYEQILNDTDKEYYTSGNSTPFKAVAAVTVSGKHLGEKVIRFFTHGTEKARSYPCCWGHKTNCNRAWIDCFTKNI
jgi:hypothetical protein